MQQIDPNSIKWDNQPAQPTQQPPQQPTQRAPVRGPVYGPGPAPTAVNAERRAQEDQALERQRFELQQQNTAQSQAIQAENLRLRQEAEQRAAEKDARERARAGKGLDATEGERKAAAFLIRALGSNSSYESTGVGARSLPGQTLRDTFPNLENYFISGKRQRADSAQDEFIAASLRQDSGAAIPEEEMERQRRIYFPMPGDGPEAIEQKRQARLRAIEGLKQSAGRLLEPTLQNFEAEFGGQDQQRQGGARTPETVGGLPKGSRGQLKIDRILSGFSYENFLMEQGIDPNAAGLVDAFWAQNKGNKSLTPQDVIAYYRQVGLEPPSQEDAIAGVKWARGGGNFYPYMAREYQDAKDRIEQRIAEHLEFKDQKDGEAGLGDLSPASPILDEVSGVVQGVSDLLTGEGTFREGFAVGSGSYSARNEEARENTGTLGTAYELLGAGSAIRSVGGVSNALRVGRGIQASGGKVTRNALQRGLTRQSAKEGAALGASYGAAEGETLQERGTNALAGGVIGGSIGGVAQGIANRIGNRAQPAASGSRAIPDAQDVVEEGARRNVPVMTTDVVPPQSGMGRFVKQTLPEKIPFAGTSGPRSKQQEARVAAVESFVDEVGGNARRDLYNVDDGFTEQVSTLLTQQRGEKVRRLTNAKKAVIESIEQPFVAAPETTKAIALQVRQLQEIDETEFAPVIERLQRFGDAITSGKPLSVVEEQRKLLGQMFEDANLASIKDRGQKAVNAIYKPLVDDMGSFIRAQKGQGAFNRWSKANEELAAMAGELKSTAFKRVLRDSETTPESVGRILFNNPDAVSDMRRLVSNLDDAGKAKVRAAIIQRAFDRAGGSEGVSVERFLNNLTRDGKKLGIAFEGKDRESLEGLRRLLEATRRASTASSEVRTGEQNVPAVMGIGATSALGFTGGVASLGVGGLVARLYESPIIRNRLIGLARAKPGSKQERDIVASINKVSAPIVQSWRNSANDNAVTSSLAAQGGEQENEPKLAPPK